MAAKKASNKKRAKTRASKKQSTRSSSRQEYSEFPTGKKIGTALVHSSDGRIRALQYIEIDDVAIFEGDICLGTIEEVERNSSIARQMMRGEVAAGVVIPGANRHWTNCQVPFTIDSALTAQDRVTDAIAHWEANTNYRFIERTSANASQFPDFVTFRPAGNCSSRIGRRGGQQFINLGTGCSTGNTIHEIGHTIGLWHEQSREDRDAFVTINFANIDPAAVSNFDQHITDGDDVGAYDYGSIMHYPRTAFTINGLETITPTDPTAVIGQRAALSPGDIAAANSLCTPPIIGTPNKFIDDIDTGTLTKFADDNTLNKFSDDGTVNKFADDGTPNKFSDDGTASKFLDDGGGTNKLLDDGGSNKQFDDVKSPAQDKGPLDVGPTTPGRTPQQSGTGRLPFALATPHHAPPAMVAAAGGIGHMDPAQLGQSIDQLHNYVQELARRLSDPALAQHGPTALQELEAEYQRAASELQQSIELYRQLTERGQ